MISHLKARPSLLLVSIFETSGQRAARNVDVCVKRRDCLLPTLARICGYLAGLPPPSFRSSPTFSGRALAERWVTYPRIYMPCGLGRS